MQESLKDSNSWNFVNIPPPFLMSKENWQAAGKEENTSTAATSHILLFQQIKPWSCTPQPALLDIMDRAEFIHTKGTSLHIGVQAGAEANLLAAAMPTDIMFACMHTYTYSIYKACVHQASAGSSRGSETQRLFGSSDLEGLFFVP